MHSATLVRKNAIERVVASPPREHEYDLQDVFKILRRRLGVIIGTVLFLTTCAGLLALNLTPRYTARSTIVVEPRETHIIDFDETQGDVPPDTSMINTHVKYLTSNSFTHKVIERLNLVRDPEFYSAIGKDNGPDQLHPLFAEALNWAQIPLVAIGLVNQPPSKAEDPLSSRDRSSAEELALATVQVERSEPWVEIREADHSPARGAIVQTTRLVSGLEVMDGALSTPDERSSLAMAEDGARDATMDRVTEAFLQRLEVSPSGQSYAISIDFTSVVPKTAARVANTMADLYVEHQLGSKQAAATGALRWLPPRLDELREQLVQSERAAAEYRVQNELAASGDGLEFSEEELAALTHELITAQAERVATQAKLDLIRQVRSSGQNLESIPEVMMSPIIADLRQQEMELLRTEAQLSQEYGPRHPTMMQVRADKGKLAARADAEIRNIIGGLANQVATIQVREQTLRTGLARAKVASTDKSRAEIQLRLLEGEVESTRTLYTMLLDRFKELTAQRELLEPGVRVISAAALPVKPSSPQVRLITGAGFMGSLMFGTLLAFVIDRLDRGLRTGRQAEEVLNLPQIGFIPKLRSVRRRHGAHHYLAEKPTSAYAEAIREVQSGLYFSNIDKPPQVVLITSSVPAEGKTTLALSLATVLAQSGCKTVAVDLDLRRPSLGLPARENGGGDLVDYMRGEKILDEILHEDDEVYNLHIVPARRLTASPTDLLASRRMSSLIAELRARYDYIILDSPPVLGMSDSRFAARLSDAVVFVVLWGKTGEEVARKALDILRDSGALIAGAVLTQVDVRRHRKWSPEEVLHYYEPYKKYYVN
jgi:succinoglycan biosynthesis transport protein ExoP